MSDKVRIMYGGKWRLHVKDWAKNLDTLNKLIAATNNEQLDTLCKLSRASRTGFRGFYE